MSAGSLTTWRSSRKQTGPAKSFLTSFENFIGVLLFFFVPWSAINPGGLTTRSGGETRCAVVLHPDGIYERIQWWAGICHVITLAVQVPFLDQLFYAGPLVKPPGGADISWIAGFGVASLLYSAGAKRFVSVRPGLAAASTVGTAS